MSENLEMVQELTVSPKKIKAKKGTFQVTINNREQRKNVYRLEADDPDELCSYNFSKDTVTAEAGATVNVILTVSFKNGISIGTPKTCRFTVRATKSTGEVETAEGRLERPARFPMWMLAAGGAAVVAIIAIVIVLAGGGDDTSNNSGGTQPPSDTDTYNVSVVVSGLTGTLVLQNNSGDNLTITANGSFSFAESLSDGSAYNVTVLTPPAGQTCTVSNGSGTISSSNVTDVAVTCTATGISGVWLLEVSNVNSTCGPEGSWSSTITIVQEGALLETTGLKGTSFIVTGSVVGETVIIGPGAFPEEGGTTTATYTMTIVSDTLMEGAEAWTWTDGTDTCSNGTATIRATKIE